jgi:hypothetical protein
MHTPRFHPMWGNWCVLSDPSPFVKEELQATRLVFSGDDVRGGENGTCLSNVLRPEPTTLVFPMFRASLTSPLEECYCALTRLEQEMVDDAEFLASPISNGPLCMRGCELTPLHGRVQRRSVSMPRQCTAACVHAKTVFRAG